MKNVKYDWWLTFCSLLIIAGAGFLLHVESDRREKAQEYKYHLKCGDTDHGVVYHLRNLGNTYKFERPNEGSKQYSVTAKDCITVKVGE